jgi:hypothetical protein
MKLQIATEREYNLTLANYRYAIDNADAATYSDGLSWYARQRDVIADLAPHVGLKQNELATIVAALSPLIRWEDNIGAALKLISGGSWSDIGGLNTNKAKAEDILYTKDTSLARGPKVAPFARALSGDDSAIVVDTWQLRLSAWAITGAAYNTYYPPVARRTVREIIGKVADERNIEPCQAQAISWLFIRENWPNVQDYARGADFNLASALFNSR